MVAPPNKEAPQKKATSRGLSQGDIKWDDVVSPTLTQLAPARNCFTSSMKFSPYKRWTRAEKWLFGSPVLVGLFAAAMTMGPQIVRKEMGYPDFILKTAPGVGLSSLALSPDGTTLAATGVGATIPQNGDIWIWDARTLGLRVHWPGGSLNRNISVASGIPSQMVWSSNGKQLSFGRENEPFRGYDVASRRVLWSWGRASCFDRMRLSPDGLLLFVPDRDKDKAAYAPLNAATGAAYALLDAATGKVQSRWRVRGFSDDPAVSFAPDGKTLASIGPRHGQSAKHWYLDGRHIEIRRVSDGHLLQTIVAPWTRTLEFSPDGSRLLAVGESEHNSGVGITGSKVVCFSVASKTPLWTYGRTRGDFPEQAIWSPDGTSVAVAAGTNRILLLDANTGAIKTTLRDPNSVHGSSYSPRLAYSPDGKRLFARGKNAVLVWNLD